MGKLTTIIKHRNFAWRVLLVILFIIPLLFIKDFYIHFYAHFLGTIFPHMITQQWHIVILNIVLFLLFLVPLSFRRKIDWKEYGLVTAFFISLFVEMYGIPLTIFLASKSLAGSEIVIPNSIVDFEFLGVGIRMTHAMLYGTILMVIGTFLIIIGWVTLYKNIQDNKIVTIGIYAYSRHPQYLGFVFIILGWIIGWPSILAVIFGIILIFVYIRVSILEEKELSHLKEYQGYKKKVPFLI